MINIEFSDEVRAAKDAGQPMVALESTIVTHGMPFPQNVETARMVEQDIRDGGAVPATLAVLEGTLHVGLNSAQLDKLAQTEQVAKLSRADFAIALSEGWTGSTTVAATMIAARMAGIEVFATGGIGGVHRGAETSMDVSADLQELAKTPVNVVAAGAKAILDIPKTLEVLETLGVPVIAYGQDAFPAFWSRDAGLPAPVRLDSAASIAKAYRARMAVGLEGGQLIANPIPAQDEISAEVLRPIIKAALKKADEQRIAAKAVTPFLLNEIFELTKGASLTANIALVRNNARLAAEIAQALVRLR